MIANILYIYLSGLALDTSLLQCLVVTVTAVSSAPKASWVVLYTMNNHTYNAMRESDNRLVKHCMYQSCLGAKDTTQNLLETLVGLLKKRCCHQKRCGCVGGAAV